MSMHAYCMHNVLKVTYWLDMAGLCTVWMEPRVGDRRDSLERGNWSWLALKMARRAVIDVCL